MTQNQLAYWKLEEQKRADKENERISDVQARAALRNAITNRKLADFETGKKFKDSQDRFIGDFILKWGSNLGGLANTLLSASKS